MTAVPPTRPRPVPGSATAAAWIRWDRSARCQSGRRSVVRPRLSLQELLEFGPDRLEFARRKAIRVNLQFSPVGTLQLQFEGRFALEVGLQNANERYNYPSTA